MRGTHAKHKPFLNRLPHVWLMTDDVRLADPRGAIAQLPRGAGVIFRHYHAPERMVLAQQLAALCARRGLVFLVAGDWRLAAKIGARGVHLGEGAAQRGLAPGGRLWRKAGARVLTAAAHGPRGLRRAAEIGADVALLAPIFRTASHPDRAPLGVTRATAFIRAARVPVMLLGGMTTAKYKRMRASGAAGLAGIGFAGEGKKRA